MTAKVRIGDEIELLPDDGSYGLIAYVQSIVKMDDLPEAVVCLRPAWSDGSPSEVTPVRALVTRDGSVVIDHATLIRRGAVA